MAATSRRWQLAGLIFVTLACMACNPLMIPYFLLSDGLDPKADPKFRLVKDDKKKPVKVVIFTSSPMVETRRELVGANRELAAAFAHQLQEGCKRNKENVIVASNTKVQQFQDKYPMWQSLSLEELGKRLEADYVIDLEINELSLFDTRSQDTLLGKATISVTVVDVHRGDEGPVFHDVYVTEYPRSGSKAVMDTNLLQFRRAFLTRVAKDLSWLFTAHPASEDYSCE